MNLDEMRKLGMRPRQTAFLTVMEWPEPFAVLPWWDAEEAIRAKRRNLDQPTLWDALPLGGPSRLAPSRKAVTV